MISPSNLLTLKTRKVERENDEQASFFQTPVIPLCSA